MSRGHREAGLSLVELIVTVAILAVLATIAVPVARFRVQREKERELRYDLWQMRDAIDHYKDAAERGGFQVKIDTEGYPPDLRHSCKRGRRAGQESEISTSHSG